MNAGQIELRGVAVHNLRDIDLDVPHRQLVVICGVSGSGKTSLALDTLYAEGQRRYIESFSAYARQFLSKLDKPAARRIDGIPPSIAVTRNSPSQNSRATVATATEIYDHLGLLFAKIGEVVCHGCGHPVQEDSPETVAQSLIKFPAGKRFMVTFSRKDWGEQTAEEIAASLQEEGFVRVIVEDRALPVEEMARFGNDAPATPIAAVVDRLTTGNVALLRLREAIEIAYQEGEQRCVVLLEADHDENGQNGEPVVAVDGRPWQRMPFSNDLRCESCGFDFPRPEPRLFSFNSPLGACETCEGFGNVVELDMQLVVPDDSKTLRERAIAPWTTKAYSHELDKLLALADDYDLPVDTPWANLTDEQRRLVHEGVPERDFGGLDGFFAWLEKHKNKVSIRVFLNRWRSYRPCPQCHGSRLRSEALAVKVGDCSIAQITAMEIRDAQKWFQSLTLTPHQQMIARLMLAQIAARLNYLESVGLGYIGLNRSLQTLSGGETQRVTLATALGSVLVNMLYVLDEPSVGLHPHDVTRLVKMLTSLRDRGNSVVVVEHEESIIRSADQLIEIGPAAGRNGGKVVYHGEPAGVVDCKESITGDYLAGRRGVSIPSRRLPDHGRLTLKDAVGNNLQNLTVEFPLNLLCVVSGVSGSGKTTLVHDTLYPALCQRMKKDSPPPLACDGVLGDGQIDDCILVDQSPIGRSPRSNPVTYIKAFDAIRNVFAETIDARTHNYTASHFSFNVDGGRCTACDGDGYQQIDMQFMSDVLIRCPSCRGARYRREILEVKYRDRNIAEVLSMTAREAFGFFRGQIKVQNKLKSLIDVGLEYLQLGQPASTLSAGEAQRLKLAGYLGSAKKARTLFILDEPTTGLHFADVLRLLDCFESLVAVGHSLLVVEHNLQLMKSADWIIDLGPGAAADGGQVVIEGSPEAVAACDASLTGKYLRPMLAQGRT